MRTVAADRARDHVDRLLAKYPGSLNHIAALAGLSSMPPAVRHGGRITVETEERLLAVTQRHLALLPPYHVPRGPVLRHIETLLEVEHSSLSQIGRVAGVSYQTMYNLRSGASEQCRWSTYSALMAVTPEVVASNRCFESPRASVTRLRALQANGWPRDALDAMLGATITSCVLRRDTMVTTSVAARIKDLYERIGDTPGPSMHARRRAAAGGYKTPIHYDDDMNLVVTKQTWSEQERARTYLCIIGQTIENRSNTHIRESLGTTEKHVGIARRQAGLRIEQSFDGTYVAVEVREGAIAAARSAVKPLHYWTTLDCLDDGPLDYLELWQSLLAHEGASSAA